MDNASQPDDHGHELRALTFQPHEGLSHLRSHNALITTAPTAPGSFIRVLGGRSIGVLTCTGAGSLLTVTMWPGHVQINALLQNA